MLPAFGGRQHKLEGGKLALQYGKYRYFRLMILLIIVTVYKEKSVDAIGELSRKSHIRFDS
jgi:hypothetical protein